MRVWFFSLLVLDFAGNGTIETRDILSLGGNGGTSPTREAALANEYADLQRNNVQWLDANRDGSLTAADPAFAAIRLWIDTNQDGIMQAQESQGMAAQGITSINFRTGVVSYANGTTNSVSAQTLTAETSGIRVTNMFTGTTDDLNAMNAALQRGDMATAQALADQFNGGRMVEHEGYQGQVHVTDSGGTRWVSEREQTYQHDAIRTADLNAGKALKPHLPPTFTPSNMPLAQRMLGQNASESIAILLAAVNSHIAGWCGNSANTSNYRLAA